MIYELRTYWAAEGKIEALHTRFRNVTMGVFVKHEMTVVGFWTPLKATADSGDLVYIMAFSSEAAMKEAWDAFRVDPDWINGKAESEKDGVLVTKLTSVVMSPTDFSPIQ